MTNFDYDALPPDEALPDSDMRRNLVPIESASDGGIIAWATDDSHARAIVRALNAAAPQYEAELAGVPVSVEITPRGQRMIDRQLNEED